MELVVPQQEIIDTMNTFLSVNEVLTTSDVLMKIALDVKNNIFLRTIGGKDFQYNPFIEYRDKYLKYKKAKGKDQGNVNLSLTGTMLNAMTQKALNNYSIKIFFTNKQESDKAERHNTTGYNGLRKRKFFFIGDKDKELALQTYNEAIYKSIQYTTRQSKISNWSKLLRG